MAILCDYCETKGDKRAFCNDKCRMNFKRHGKLVRQSEQKTSLSVRSNEQKEHKEDSFVRLNEQETPLSVRLDEQLVRQNGYDHLPNRFKPALSWRDDKGQCQHKLKMCQLCQ